MKDRYDLLDTDAWSRKDAFQFFRHFDEPFFNICTQVEIGGLLQEAANKGFPPSLLLLWHVIRVANDVEAFRLRLNGEEVRRYDLIRPACTIRRGENSFFFCYFDFEKGMTAADFIEHGRAAVDAQQRGPGLGARSDVENVIHCSMLPWTSFTGVRHPRHSGYPDSIPKIILGKYTEIGGKWMLPVSVDLHHALADGWHAAQWLERMEWRPDPTP